MIYENIQRLCKERGISVAQLEKGAGLLVGTVHKWKKSMPGADKVKAVANYLGVSMETVMGSEDPEPPAGVIRLMVNGESIMKDTFQNGLELTRKIISCCGDCTGCTVTVEIGQRN